MAAGLELSVLLTSSFVCLKATQSANGQQDGTDKQPKRKLKRCSGRFIKKDEYDTNTPDKKKKYVSCAMATGLPPFLYVEASSAEESAARVLWHDLRKYPAVGKPVL